MAIAPPISDNVLGHSFNQNQAIIMARAGSRYSILESFVVLPADRAMAHVAYAMAAGKIPTFKAEHGQQ